MFLCVCSVVSRSPSYDFQFFTCNHIIKRHYTVQTFYPAFCWFTCVKVHKQVLENRPGSDASLAKRNTWDDKTVTICKLTICACSTHSQANNSAWLFDIIGQGYHLAKNACKDWIRQTMSGQGVCYRMFKRILTTPLKVWRGAFPPQIDQLMKPTWDQHLHPPSKLPTKISTSPP